MKSSIYLPIVLLCLATFVESCSVSLSGISIAPDVKTFHVELFENNADLVEPTLAITLTEALKDRIRNSSRLDWDKKKPDLIFYGTISTFTISSEAPQAGATTGFNQLRIGVNIEFEDTKNDKNSWKKRFSRFANFGANQDFSAVKDQLIEEINEFIVQDIFNEAFAKNW